MEMRGQPGRVMHDVVQIVGRVDDPGDSAKDEDDQPGKEIRKEPAILVEIRKFLPPAEEAASAILARAVFHRCGHGEGGGKTRDRHQHGKEGVDELPGVADPGLGELVMNSDRSGIEHEPEKGEAAGKIGIEFSAAKAWAASCNT